MSILACNHLDGEERAGCFAFASSWHLVIVLWLFLTVPWVCLQFVIGAFTDHTHIQFTMFFLNVGWKNKIFKVKSALTRIGSLRN